MSYTLTIETTGDEIEVEEGQTMLDACLRAGVWLPHACCHGMCGTCKIDVVDGEIEHGEASGFALMDFERDEGKALACCATLESDVSIEAEIEEDPDAESIPVEDFNATVERIDDLTPTIKGLHLRLDRPIRFQPGQYINLTIAGKQGTSRAFSIASDMSDPTKLELNIRLVPGGEGTSWVHNELQVGDSVHLTGPYGRFFVRHSAQMPTLLLAGGSGLSSPRSMLLDLIARKEEQPITIVYGARNRSELYYHDELAALAEEHDNVTYVPALSDEPADSEWDGFRGFVHEAAETHFDKDFRGHKAYICGPPVMIEACITSLMRGRLFERDIYTEKFLSAADVQQTRSPLFKRI
jgi:phenol hydroxylase P5 protein